MLRPLLAVFLISVTAVPALAQAPPPRAAAEFATRGSPIDQFTKANAALLEWSRAREQAGESLPLLSDPTAARLIAAAFDEFVIPALKARGLVLMQGDCQVPAANMAAYIFSGTAGLSGDAMAEAQGRNFLRYQEELVSGLVFNLSCAGALSDLAEPFVANLSAQDLTAARRTGVEQMRHGAFNMYAGMVGVQHRSSNHGADDVSDANAERLLDAAVRNVDPLSRIMTREYRRQVVATIDEAAADTRPEAKERLARIRAAMSREDCGVMCSLVV